MKIILTGGGTAGHVTPNLALIPKLKELKFDIHYIGTKDGMERQLVERENIPYHFISAGKLRRYLDIKNISDLFKIGSGFLKALSIIRKLKPNIVFSKGGFVSCPVVWAAWVNKIPVVIHESDMTPGLANKLAIPFAKKICYTFPETKDCIGEDKVVLTGIPVRDSLYGGDILIGKKTCGFDNSRPIIIVIGGSQGSSILNKSIRDCLDELIDNYQICHICGKDGMESKLNDMKGYKQFEYINEELPHIFAAADIFISRAGATTLFEILALKKPNLLIPLSKKSSRGDQILNAESFEKQGFSKVIMEEDLNEEKFIKGINEVYINRKKYIENMENSNYKKGIDEVIKVIQENCK